MSTETFLRLWVRAPRMEMVRLGIRGENVPRHAAVPPPATPCEESTVQREADADIHRRTARTRLTTAARFANAEGELPHTREDFDARPVIPELELAIAGRAESARKSAHECRA